MQQVRDALRTYPWTSAVGQSGIHNRMLADLSDEALLVLSEVLMQGERLMTWPENVL